jgi:hypothetical protein
MMMMMMMMMMINTEVQVLFFLHPHENHRFSSAPSRQKEAQPHMTLCTTCTKALQPIRLGALYKPRRGRVTGSDPLHPR